MPVVLRLANAIEILINTREQNHARPHFHVRHADKTASIALDTFEVLANSGFSQKTLKRVVENTKPLQNELMEIWNEYHKE
jgi:hypothetical protein